MKTEISISIILAALVMTNVGFASPLTDYTNGRTAIEVGFQNQKISEQYKDYDYDDSYAMPDAHGKGSFNLGITYGLGNRLALQYQYNAPQSKDTNLLDSNGNALTTFHTKLKHTEYNLLYQLNKNVSVYTGIVKVRVSETASPNIDDDYSGGDTSTNTKSIWQNGLVYSTPIMDRTTGYAMVAYGKDLSTYKVGLSYEIAKNVEFDTYYGYNHYKAMQWSGYNAQSDFTAKGMGFGLTVKY